MSQPPVAANAAAAPSSDVSSTSVVTTSSSTSITSVASSRSSTRSGSIVLPHSLTSCSHINVCRPWISWKKGNMSEYVSKPRVFFDHFHHQIVLFTGSPPNKMWFSDRKTQTWMDYPVHLPPHNDIIGAQFSPDRSHVALRVSDKEVKVLSTSTGEVVTARSCRGTSSRMISVHWLHDPALAKSSNNSPPALFLLFVTNAGVELYELTNEKSLLNINLPGSSNLTGAAAAAPGTAAAPATTSKLKHIKTATYNIVYHWILLDENILLLVDTKNVFQAYKLSSKQITKICKFELDCGGTSLNPPQMVQFHREQISLVWLYGRMVIIFVNEVKGQLHLLSLSSPSHSEEMEQTHVFDLYQPGRYDVSNIDNVLVVHNTATRVSMLFDVRSESKTTITEPLPIGPPLNNGNYVYVAGGGNSSTASSPAKISSHTTVTASGSTSTIDFFDPAALSDPATKSGAAGIAASPRPSPGMASLAPANFHPYVKWTFLAPCYVWESTGDQQQGNLWTLQMNYQQIAYSWPHSKRTRLVDFLLKRSSVAAKQLILQLILQIVCTEPHSLALLSRLFSLLNRMNYDHRMNPNAAIAPNLSLANLPLLPPFSNPPSAASTAPNSNFASPFAGADGRSASASVSASPLKAFPPNSPLISNAQGAGLPSFGSASRMSVASASPTHRASTSISSANQSFSNLSLSDAAATGSSAAAAINNLSAAGSSFELDDSLSVLSCEMLDIAALLSQPMTVDHNLHGYILISQLDIFLHVFERARPHIPLGQLIPVVVEYLRSIHRHFLKAEDILNDYLVSLLLAAGRHFEFHQYLQYHILNDSLPIANRLIACAHVYPPAYQLGIDMLYRLNQIPRLIRVMLNHHQVLAALQLIPSYRSPIFENAQGGLTPRDFLSTAWNTGDRIMFYHTFKFFEQRNIVIRNNATFLSGDGCDQYVFEFNQLFGNQPPPPPLVLMNASGSGARGSVASSPPVAVSGGASNLQSGKLQYLNLGDDDDEVLEDDDIEYDEEGIANFASTASAAEAAEAEAAAAAESASSSSFVSSPTSEKSEVVQIPAPLDLSTTIPSVTVSSGAGEEEEDNAAESGLGVDQSTILEQSMSSDSLAPEITSPHLTLDGSFGGLSGNTSTPAPHDGKKKKPAKNFKAEPAM